MQEKNSEKVASMVVHIFGCTMMDFKKTRILNIPWISSTKVHMNSFHTAVQKKKLFLISTRSSWQVQQCILVFQQQSFENFRRAEPRFRTRPHAPFKRGRTRGDTEPRVVSRV